VIYYKSTEGTGYKPYFYEAGLYLWKSPETSAAQKLYKEQSGEYNFTSDLNRGQRTYTPQTIEQIIKRGYLAVTSEAPETAILSDKQRTFWQGLDDIIRQVRQRYEIAEGNIYQIERSICYALSRIYQVESHRGGVPADAKERYRLLKQVQELYQQEREEKVSLWQDISRLKLAMPETAQQFLSAHRKVSILKDPNSELN
jgi:predicted DNA binding CopG/RHH family protein